MLIAPASLETLSEVVTIPKAPNPYKIRENPWLNKIPYRLSPVSRLVMIAPRVSRLGGLEV